MRKTMMSPVLSWTLKELGAKNDEKLGNIQNETIKEFIDNSEIGECLNMIETNFLLDGLPNKRIILDYKINRAHYLEDEGYHEPIPVKMQAILDKIVNCGDCFMMIANDFFNLSDCCFILRGDTVYII